MNTVTHEHFGGNLILTKDTVYTGSSFREMTEEIFFSRYRYPGGRVTEDQTWENGGLARMFGEPMRDDDPNYVLTLREAMGFARETGTGMTIVTPTYQFFDSGTKTFDHDGFEAYLAKLETVLLDYPDVQINDFEIGNEYWSEISASDYGKIANEQIPLLDAMSDRLAARLDSWEKPGIGIQAGAGWRANMDEGGRWYPTGTQESLEIVAEIDLEHREMVDTLYQHAYPDAGKGDWQRDWHMDPVWALQKSDGFPEDLKISISEFNIAMLSASGVHQGAKWVEEFAAYVDRGIDEFQHWGLNYEWLSNKFYDSKFPSGESDNGEILTKATPMDQFYDLASTHLPGKSVLSDEEALDGIAVSDDFIVTGFRDAGQKVLFLHNQGDNAAIVDLSPLPPGWHVSAHHLVNADSPHSTWYNESITEKPAEGQIADARGDMKVLSGQAVPDEMTLDPEESLVLIMSEPGRDLLIEGAHNETDHRTGMVDDRIFGGDGDDILRGHVGDDLIAGGAGRDVISGGKDNDTVSGGDGDDVLVTGRGTNEADGGEGDDLFIVTGGRETDSTTITTGRGDDLILTADDQNLTIVDFQDNDSIGFDGAFLDAEAFQNAARVEDEDLIVDLPGGGMVRIVGQAEKLDSIHNRVIDFSATNNSEDLSAARTFMAAAEPDLPVAEAMLDGLSYEQLIEFYDIVGDIDGLSDEGDAGTAYWLGLDGTIERTGVAPYEPDPYEGTGTEPGSGEPPTTDPEIPEVPPVIEEDYEPYPEEVDDEQDQASAAGGSCFVATAAFGDRMHPDVVTLRRFRDCHLVKCKAGRAFVRFYWRVGPVLARRTKPDDIHGRLARAVLATMTSALRKFYQDI